MNQLPQIKAAYDWFLAEWKREAVQLTNAGDIAALTSFEEKRDALERGFFVLMFGQFEVAVNATFEAAKAARIDNPDWTHRRGWDAPSLNGPKVPFDTKLSMVLDRRSPSFGNILNTYATRNHCAHGGTTVQVGSIDALESDLYTWQAQLRN